MSADSSGLPGEARHSMDDDMDADSINGDSPDASHHTPHEPGAQGLSSAPRGGIVIDPNAPVAPNLNPRSCVTCRRRKVRCDKHMPCGNCRKAQISCIFPAPGRAPRRPRPKDPNAPPKQTSEREVELMKRLRKLEGIVEELSGQIEVENSRHPSSGNSPDTFSQTSEERRLHGSHSFSPRPAARFMSVDGSGLHSGKPDSPHGVVPSPTSDVSKDIGRLVLNEKGKTRYVSNTFWSKLTDELDQLRADTQAITDEDYSDEEDGSTPSTNAHQHEHNTVTSDHHAFVFGYRSADVDLKKLHPLPSQIPFIWQVFVENVDPLLKVLHVPSMDKTIRVLRTNLAGISPSEEALMFSIYYAAITSMEEDEVKVNFGAEKSHLIEQYRFATEQALAKANFINSSDIIVVQAFVMFLVLVRRHDDTRFAWSMTGLAVRIAQSLGIHREGTMFAGLSPFDIEMRRRLWWAICSLDLRAAEDQGTEVMIHDRTFDTKFPLNVNDKDISPDMTELPQEKEGPTDMTFSLVRYEICSLGRRMQSGQGGLSPCPKDSTRTLQEREAELLDTYARIEDTYLRHCTEKDGDLLHWVAATIARLIMAKMSLLVYQPILFSNDGGEVDASIRDRLFMSSVEVVEYNSLLNTEPKTRQWRWLFQTYTQWHAVAFLLLEMVRRPWSASVERGWIALNSSFFKPQTFEVEKLVQHSAVLLPLRKLMSRANRHRQAEIARLRSDPSAAKALETTDSLDLPPASFQHLPSSLRNTLARERWRKLVGQASPPKPTGPHSCIGDLPTTQPPVREEVNQTAQIHLKQLDGAMGEPDFNPMDFLSIAFSEGGGPNELARMAMFNPNFIPGVQGVPGVQDGNMGGAKPNSDTSTLNFFPHGGANAAPIANQMASPSPVPGSTQVRTGSAVGTAPARSQSYVETNPPPWLWSDPWGTGPETATPVTADEADINMDENFDWDNWQESVRGFELDSGINMPGRSGFAGGL